MGRYLDIANGIPRTEAGPANWRANPTNLTKPDTENARRLLVAEWKPKVSFGGRVIWERPDDGFYRSEEAAICLLERIGNADRARRANRELENNPMQDATKGDATLRNDFDKKGEA